MIDLDDIEPEFGYVFAFAPAKPVDPESRQAYELAQLKWLELWEPWPGSLPH